MLTLQIIEYDRVSERCFVFLGRTKDYLRRARGAQADVPKTRHVQRWPTVPRRGEGWIKRDFWRHEGVRLGVSGLDGQHGLRRQWIY